MPLREDAETIWRAGVAAVDSSLAVQRQFDIEGNLLRIADVDLNLTDVDRIEILGAGKAGAGMASGIECALFPHMSADRVAGWVNVPADCLRPLQRIHLHNARPAGLNEPTQDAVDGTEEILRRIQSLTRRDICIVLLSGGASALLCSPVPQITLAEKLSVTRALAGAGAPIHDLNIVRTQLSQVKGGRLADACQAGVLIAMIISDVIGDSLEIIGSGPTTPAPPRPREAIEILSKYALVDRVPKNVIRFLTMRSSETEASAARSPISHTPHDPPQLVRRNVIVASNSIALRAAEEKATQLGYQTVCLGSDNAGEAADEGRRLMETMRSARAQMSAVSPQPVCILSGGEPTVNLRTGGEDGAEASTATARGGRNQELVLAAIAQHPTTKEWTGLSLLSGGTDGEDGPTDAAGAVANKALLASIEAYRIDPAPYLARHDSYNFFSAVDGLLKTGPTHTNVMDLRVGLIDASASD
jgi:glycerate 2-kinase